MSYENAENVSAGCSAFLAENQPDVARLMELWPDLPAATRQRILKIAERAKEKSDE